MALTQRQQRFVEEFLVDLNATQAAIRAGYSARSAKQVAGRMMQDPRIQEAIQAGRQAQRKRTEVTADRVLKELARVAFSDVGDVLDFDGDDPKLRPAKAIPKAARRAIASVKVKRFFEGAGDDAREVEVTEFKFWDKIAALQRLAAHLGIEDGKPPPPGSDENPLRIRIDFSKLTDEELTALERLAERAAGPAGDPNGNGAA